MRDRKQWCSSCDLCALVQESYSLGSDVYLKEAFDSSALNENTLYPNITDRFREKTNDYLIVPERFPLKLCFPICWQLNIGVNGFVSSLEGENLSRASSEILTNVDQISNTKCKHHSLGLRDGLTSIQELSYCSVATRSVRIRYPRDQPIRA